MNLRKYLVLLGVVIFGASGDALLSRGMRQLGEIPLNHWQKVIFAVVHPWVALGVLLLMALSWQDVSLVAPASASLTFIANAVAARIFLHEHVDRRRWIAALLVAGGVALVAI